MSFVLSKTPFRMSFVGGGSDIPDYYRANGGAVISTAIDQYMYIAAKYSFENEFILHYSKTERVEKVEDISHPLIREVFKEFKIRFPLQVSSMADIPASGTGLGSSSSFTVGLANVISNICKKRIKKEVLAELACMIEIERCGEPIGKQDQYAAACGGFNVFEFNSDDTVTILPVNIAADTKIKLESYIQVFYTNTSRSTSSILKEQKNNILERQKIALMQRMVQLVYDLKKELECGRLDNFGDILSENWILKKQMSSGVSNLEIDNAYNSALDAGALGGKILGAGGGGFFMTFAPPEFHNSISETLGKYKECKFKFEPLGSTIVFDGGQIKNV